VKAKVVSGSNTHAAWQEVVRVSAAIDQRDPYRALIENLLAGQWSKGVIKLVPDVTKVLDSWKQVNALCAGANHARTA